MKGKKIYILFSVIVILMLLVWFFAYRPVFSGDFSVENTDWGGFGDFFWGLGVMCLTALNVYVFWLIQQQMLRDSLVRDLRTLVEKIRAGQNSNDEKVIISRIESFKFAVASTVDSGLLSEETEECVKRLLSHLQLGQINYDAAPYFCEAIVYAISINKSIDKESSFSKSNTITEVGLIEKLHLWDTKVREEVIENAEEAKTEDVPKRSFADYLQGEILAAKRLSTLYPKARVYPQRPIPNSNLVMDALVVPKEGGKEIIVEIKSRMSEQSAKRAVRQLLLCKQAYKNAYNKEPDLAVAFTEDPKKYLPMRVARTIIDNEFQKHGISLIILKA